MQSRIFRTVLCCALSSLLLFGGATAAPLSSTKSKNYESQAVLNVLAVAAAKSAFDSTDHFDLCPIDPTMFNTTTSLGLPKGLLDRVHALWSSYSPVFAGKSLEISLKEMGALSPTHAKAIGKMFKDYQAGKGIYAITMTGISVLGAVRASERLLGKRISMSYLAALTALAITVEQVSKPQMMIALSEIGLNDLYVAIDHWVGRQLYRISTTGCRYALEKLLQKRFFDDVLQKQVAFWIASHSNFAMNSAARLAQGASIGQSKLETSLLGASIISITELSFDALQDESEYATTRDRLMKYFQDLGSAIAISAVYAVSLPSTIVAFGPRKVVYIVLAVNTFFFVIFVVS